MRAETIGFNDFLSGEYKKSRRKEKTPQRCNLKTVAKRLAPVPILSFLSGKYALASTQDIGPVAVEVVSQSTKDSIIHAFDPLIELMIDLALPIAGVMITGGALLIMIGQKDKGFSLIMNASLGYVLVNLSPIFINLLAGVGKAL